MSIVFYTQEPKDEWHKKHGVHIHHWGNGRVRFRGEYEHGVPVGEWLQYHENGDLWSKCKWKNGDFIGLYTNYSIITDKTEKIFYIQ